MRRVEAIPWSRSNHRLYKAWAWKKVGGLRKNFRKCLSIVVVVVVVLVLVFSLVAFVLSVVGRISLVAVFLRLQAC